MPRRRNLRMETYNKLISIGKSTEKDILNLKIEDLKEVSGIGDSKFEKIKDRICV